MIRQLLRLFAVTIAFAAGATATELLLELQAVRALVGLATDTGVSLPAIAEYLGIAILAGLIVDGLRFVAGHWWHGNRQLQHDLEDVFNRNLV